MARLDKNFDEINDAINFVADRTGQLGYVGGQRYSIFARLQKTSSGTSNYSVMIGGVGSILNVSTGLFAVFMEYRGGYASPSMQATPIVAPTSGSIQWGWYESDGWFYFGVRRPAYGGYINIIQVGGNKTSTNFEIGDFGQTSAAPEGWTAI